MAQLNCESIFLIANTQHRMHSILCFHCKQVNLISARNCAACQRSLLFADRFLIGEPLYSNQGIVVHAAMDAWQCGQCRALMAEALENCSVCGAPMQNGVECFARIQPQPPSPLTNVLSIAAWLYNPLTNQWLGFAYPPRSFQDGVNVQFGFESVVGNTSANQDALLAHSTREHLAGHTSAWSYFAVADGMGGHAKGEIASEGALIVLDQELEKFFNARMRARLSQHNNQPNWDFVVALAQPTPVEPYLEYRIEMERAVRAANRAIAELGQREQSDLGTTLTLVVIADGYAHIANVGDSRAYLFRARELRQLTRDHSLVYSLWEQNKITRQEMYSHPQRNLITRALDGSPAAIPDLYHLVLEPNDTLLLCSDGIWESLHDEGIVEVLANESDAQRACALAIARALEANADDNLSLIIIQAQSRK